MTGLIRAFIAIGIDSRLRDGLTAAQHELKKSNARVAWVKPENIHLTLKFLGEIPPKKLKETQDIFPILTQGIHPFAITLTDLGVFPSPQRPQVLWAGLSGVSELILLAQRIETELAPLGFKKERREFTAHLTLGRVRSPHNRDTLAQKIQDYRLPEGLDQTVDHITLFQSTLTPQGSIYQPLTTAFLK